jgi:hypothetical protein
MCRSTARHAMRKTKQLFEFDAKTGMPQADLACASFRSFISEVSAIGGGVARILHGYGSSGVGGKIRTMVRSDLARMTDAGSVTAWIPAEEWCSGRHDAADFLEVLPELRAHPDLRSQNPGVTFVLVPALKRKRKAGARR